MPNKINWTSFSEISNEIKRNKIRIDNSLELIEVYQVHKKFQFIEEIKNNEHFFKLISPLTSQQKAPKQESRIINIIGGKKIKSIADKGDYVNADGDFFEIKCSTPSKDGNILNMVQIRPHQKIEYYICCFIDDINYVANYIFKLTKEQMNNEINLIGNSAHGAAKKEQINKEYRISLNLNDLNNINTKRWLNNYRNITLEEKIF